MSIRKSREFWAGANDLPYEVDLVAQHVVAATGGMTLKAVGLCLGTTKERIRQIVDGALEEYVRGMLDEGWTADELAEQLIEWRKRAERADQTNG